MADVIFWILVSFFSAIGVVEIVNYLKRLCFKDKISPPIVLIPQKDDALCAEMQVRYILSQLTIDSKVVLVDTGLNEEGRSVVNRIKNVLPVTLVSQDEVEKILSPV